MDVHFVIKKFISSEAKNTFLVDSEIWPNLIIEAANNKIPLALINARITNKILKGGRFFLYCKKFLIYLTCIYLQIMKQKNIYHNYVQKKFDLGNLKLFNNFKNKKLIT